MEQIEGKTVSDERKPVDALSAFSTLEGIVEDIVDLDADAYIELPNELLIRLMYARGTIHNVHAAIAELIEADTEYDEAWREMAGRTHSAIRRERAGLRRATALAAVRGGAGHG